MAKGLRASVKKSNRTKLRARVFEPVENARLERLHQKLLATAQQPKPDNPKKDDMELADQDAPAPEAGNEDELSKVMDMEMDIDGVPTASSKPKDRKAIRRAKKLRRTKPKNRVEFPTTRGKGALKPFSESRVRKRRS